MKCSGVIDEEASAERGLRPKPRESMVHVQGWSLTSSPTGAAASGLALQGMDCVSKSPASVASQQPAPEIGKDPLSTRVLTFVELSVPGRRSSHPRQPQPHPVKQDARACSLLSTQQAWGRLPRFDLFLLLGLSAFLSWTPQSFPQR